MLNQAMKSFSNLTMGPQDEQEEKKSQETTKYSHWRIVRDATLITTQVLEHNYVGDGTATSMHQIDWIPSDPRNPQNFPTTVKWFVTAISAFSTLTMAFASSAYTGALISIETQFSASSPVALLGVSLFVFGFAVGPLLWAPLSELYGRRSVFVLAYGLFVIFNIGAVLSTSISQLIVFRFFAGAFGSATLTNTGGMIADMFSAAERGLPSSIFASAPFLGPVIGPIAGGFLGQSAGWGGIGTLITGLSALMWTLFYMCVPETYAPYLLRCRAAKMSVKTGRHYISKMDHLRGKQTFKKTISTALLRPWKLLFAEPIVSLLSVYTAIVFGTMYMMFAAYPIVFVDGYGLSPGVAGLPFLGLAVGMLLALLFLFLQGKQYARTAAASPNGKAPPEARLVPCMIGGVATPIGLFWFAWTNGPPLNPMICIAGTVPFGFGMVLIFLSVINYLVDTYAIYAASALAANAALRSLFAASFPLFTKAMYAKLGVHWASSVPAFLALVCVPLPFWFYRYGEKIRNKGVYVQEVKRILAQMAQTQKKVVPEGRSEASLERGNSMEGIGLDEKGGAYRPCYGMFCLGCSDEYLNVCRNRKSE
ncbi:hypothetical protein ONS95_014377 [Cadophora gregata]|uniref:uncharacterized protein n=1 Tax=Cadophora gregata TaxID=51156 RepID=UPI0026DB5002|nr:uncharacterized protein ONS95_014377 [Cadophora gregata]KAK0112638.1 hypothetical protein ONS95_014377 [Cadophora gregata]KAK0124771.1 hypothetical protein ONS96_008653 [Cadophora gregata f. sp. sojae]